MRFEYAIHDRTDETTRPVAPGTSCCYPWYLWPDCGETS